MYGDMWMLGFPLMIIYVYILCTYRMIYIIQLHFSQICKDKRASEVTSQNDC